MVIGKSQKQIQHVAGASMARSVGIRGTSKERGAGPVGQRTELRSCDYVDEQDSTLHQIAALLPPKHPQQQASFGPQRLQAESTTPSHPPTTTDCSRGQR